MRCLDIFWMIGFHLISLTPAKNTNLMDDSLDTWLRNEGLKVATEDLLADMENPPEGHENGKVGRKIDNYVKQFFIDGIKLREMSILKRKARYEAVLLLFRKQNERQLSNLRNMLIYEHPKKKVEKKKRISKLRGILKTLTKKLKVLGVTKQEAKGILSTLLKKWEHDFLVKKYSEFVEIP